MPQLQENQNNTNICNFIGVKHVKAIEMDEMPFLLQKNSPFEIPKTSRPGYKVIYPDGYVSWSPKGTFDKSYLKVSENNSITQDNVDSFISKVESIKVGDKTTVTKAILKNGFIIVESSSCVDPENFSMEIGEKICIEKIKDKIWSFLGFLLQTAINGINN